MSRIAAVLLGLATNGACASTPLQEAETGPAVIEVTEAMGAPYPGQEAPDFELPDQNGQPVRLSSLRGQVVVLAFVTSWCPYSKAEQPHLAALAGELAPRGVRFLAVDVREDDAGYAKYLERVAMPFPVLRDRDGAVARAYAPPGAMPKLPRREEVPISSVVVIDEKGVIRSFGLLDMARFDAELIHTRRALATLLPEGAG